MALNYSESFPLFHIDGGHGHKLYTYDTVTRIPLETYLDRDGKFPNTNPIELDADGNATVYLLPSRNYTFVLVDGMDKIVYVAHDIVSGSDNAGILSIIADIDKLEVYINTALDKISECNLNILNADADLDNKASIGHKHKTSEISNLETGIKVEPEAIAALYEFKLDGASGYAWAPLWMVWNTPQPGHPIPPTYRIELFPAAIMNDNLVGPTAYLDTNATGLVCKKACNLSLRFDITGLWNGNVGYNISGANFNPGHAEVLKNGSIYVRCSEFSDDRPPVSLIPFARHVLTSVRTIVSLQPGDTLEFRSQKTTHDPIIVTLCMSILPTCQLPE